MSLTLKEEKKEFKVIEEGLYEAKCVSVVDLGEQETEYKGVIKYKPQVLLEFEIPELVIEYEKDGEKKTFNQLVRKFYTANLGEKSNLRIALNSWRGKAFTEEELQGFNVKKVLGKDCMIQVIHDKKTDKTKQIINILPVGKKHDPIEVENKLMSFDFDTDDITKLLDMPEWLRDKISKSKTYLALIHSDDNTAVMDDVSADDLIGEDEIPF
jgi:hypothetical protein